VVHINATKKLLKPLSIVVKGTQPLTSSSTSKTTMGCMQTKDDVVPLDKDVYRDATPTISHLHGTQSYTYTFHSRGGTDPVPPNYSIPQITVTENYAI
jgi:hypothetical protein